MLSSHNAFGGLLYMYYDDLAWIVIFRLISELSTIAGLSLS